MYFVFLTFLTVFQTNTPLHLHSNYKIGGNAKYFCCPKNSEELEEVIGEAKLKKLPIFILGGGTNILWSEKGFNGLVVKPAFCSIKVNKNRIVAGASVGVAELLKVVADNGLSGLEWAGGLPGSIGGAIRGNAGAFGGEIKDSIIEVVSLDFSEKKLKIIKRNNEQCRFAYRDSVLKSGKSAGKEVILNATFQLSSGNKRDVKRAIEDKIAWREARQPLEYPNIGSMFKNINWEKVPKNYQESEDFKKHLKIDPFPVLPAATIIDKCGLKGVSCGGAMISPKHPNFIVNLFNASADDIKALVALVKSEVKDKFDIEMEEEVVIVK